ncbi:MAG: TonB-dependent receptor plug domain-containing protein, partial [Gammaproteobacteria bacterium]|nr:TonB-dependent receptor plug domain-containing protein [Gammaproteobacteria bacterium]
MLLNKLTKKIGCTALAIVIGLLPATATAALLEEVVVTAQKREQNLQDVSTAVTALGADRLADAGITDVLGLQYYVPSVTIGTTFGYANLFIRGLGLNTVFANVDPSVTLYVDGAIIAQPGAQLFSFFDLERAEVLRGPQGTLYGRNATGGTINLVTAKPTEDLTGNIRVSAGDFGLFQAEGAVGGRISDRVLGRFAFQSIVRQDGYSTNQATGNDVDDTNKQSFRGQLLFDVTDNVDLLLSAEYGTELDAANA